MWTFVLGAGFVVLWSSGFVGATLGASAGGAITLLAWRFVLAAVLLLLWRRRISLCPRQIAVQAGLGLLSQGGYLYGVYQAADLGVAAGTSALVAALQPIAAAALGQVVLGERANIRQWAGLVGGLAGVALVVGGDVSGHPGTPLWAYALPFGAMLALVSATLLERRTTSEVPVADSLVVQCVVSALGFGTLAAATGQLAPPMTGSFWFAVLCVVVLSTFGGYGCYWLLLRRTSVTTTSSLLYLTPPVTMLAAWAMFGQQLTVSGLLGLVICFAAVALVLLPRKLSVPRSMMATCSSPMSSTPPRR
ncbi:DMT family transporter [Amycolatopsis acidicola]|uniref:DMT family transporter n=1 Tax=Amycolatopsis acidicola TaxID=2596893 RepID=A0A5N0VAL1_9PSEU|nr:DMT family transporter [Amycolatopsis acidicola]KAA9162313.1 DMT family transporter [Amycolatopsis acidicola]